MTRHLHRLIFFRESFSISAIMALYILLLRSGVSSSKYSWGRFWSFTLFSVNLILCTSTGILTYESICFIIFIVIRSMRFSRFSHNNKYSEKIELMSLLFKISLCTRSSLIKDHSYIQAFPFHIYYVRLLSMRLYQKLFW
jgi:hypothetical protein